jgi:uncharacterized SAM-binding protein YcdF (DUF218 family)
LIWPTIAVSSLCLICLPLFAYLITGTLEWSYPPLAARPDDIETIVVLGGAVRDPDAPGLPATPGTDSYYRCMAAAHYYRQGPRCPVIVSGGKARADEGKPPVAEVMKEFLTELGVAEEDIVVEVESRNTYENAVQVAKIVHEKEWKRVLLVTDATHLKRSDWCFAAQGVDVIAAGVSYGAFGFELSLSDFIPNPRAAHQVERVSHEWLGIIWYWMRGRFREA